MAQEKIEIRDLRQKEQFILDDVFLNGYAKFVGIYAVGVYCSFCRHANKEQTSWPSIETIAGELGIGRNSVIDAIKRLEFWGTVVKIRVGKMANNRYVLTNKKTWKEISEVCLKDFSEVCGEDFTSLLRKLHGFATQTSNSKEPQSKEPQKRSSEVEDDIREVEESDKPTKVGNTYTKRYNELCDWMENLTGVRFVDRRGQFKALKLAREGGISAARLKERAEDMWASGKFEAEGMDWFNVVYSFNKKA